MAVFGILTVCTGNICRSPLAELMLREGLRDVPGVEIMSAGTGARDADVMPEPAAVLAREFGLDPERHRSQRLEEAMLESSDLVLPMTREHRRTIVTSVPRVLHKSFTAREFARLAEGLSTRAILEGAPGATEFDRLNASVRLIASRRGSVPAGASADEDDVVDPYRRSDALYRQSADELAPAIHLIVRVLRTAALGADDLRGTEQSPSSWI